MLSPWVSAGQEIHLSTGQKVVLEAGAELTFKAGGSFLKLDPSGVTMVGPTVNFIPSGAVKTNNVLPTLSWAKPPYSAQYQLFKSDGRNFQGYKYVVYDGNNNIVSEGLTNEQGYTEQVVTQKSEPLFAYKSVMRESERITENWEDKLESIFDKCLLEIK